EPPAVVIPIRLVDFQNDAFGSWICGGEISSGFEFAQAFRVVPLFWRTGSTWRAIDCVELVVGLELRVQSQSKQSALLHAFAKRDDFLPQIQERPFGFFSIAVKQLNRPPL